LLSGRDYHAGQACRCRAAQREGFNQVPFFWTERYDFGLGSVGHAEKWDGAEIAGSLQASDATDSYWLGGRKQSMGYIHRDLDGLRAEVDFEAVVAGKEAMALVA
jgi:apoptosis-inducing factor 3